MEEIINIGSRRELFWDNTIVDTERTQTSAKLHHPIERECVLTFDDPWGGDGACYMSIIDDNGVFRLYNNVHRTCDYPGKDKWPHSTVCYAESTDGIHWEKPVIGNIDFLGSKENNIVFGPVFDENGNELHNFGGDGFRALVDPRPDCPPDERIKAISDYEGKLWLHVSADGMHFRTVGPLDIHGAFDSVNSLLYNEEKEVFQCYYRDYHAPFKPGDRHWIRDIRLTESKDLVHWSVPQHMRYDPFVDWELYTNGVCHYYRAPHVYFALPARYNERRIGWSQNYEQLCGRDRRYERFTKMDPRTGTAVTDALFMTSRNGVDWTRYGDAFMSPGPENPANWVYGSCYISNGIIETKSTHPGCENEISMYCAENRWMGKPAQLYRYTLRLDGFVSQNASWYTSKLFTKKLIFEGKDLFINFSTSAFGGIEIRMTGEDGRQIIAKDVFGDSCNRRVIFENGSPADFAGTPVTIEFTMCDADLYSIKFE